MICPFCREIEIDDRGEFIFVDAERLWIQVYGLVCMACGLVQQLKRDSCAYCGTILNKTEH